MSLVFGAICPHPPVLIPKVGRKNVNKIKKTKAAMEELEAVLYSKKPDTIIVITPHSPLLDEAFTINHAPQLKARFDDFGDLETELEFKNDIGLAYLLREYLETKMPVVLTTDELLDHGASVPLYCLTAHLPEIKVIPIGYAPGLDNRQHLEFGRMIRKELNHQNKRVAVIASGDLSHKLNQKSPAGYSPKGKEFDDKVIEFIKQKDTAGLESLDSGFIAEATECGLKSILVLMGIFEEMNYQPEVLSYEDSLGIGYLVANLVF